MDPSEAADQILTNLKTAHLDSDKLFLQYQQAFKSRKYGDSLALFEEYASALMDHIQTEESLLLPYYKKDLGRLKTEGFEAVLEEHRKLSEALMLIQLLHQKLINGIASDLTHRMVLKEEFYFLKLLHNHERREERELFPMLEKVPGRYN